MFHVEQKMNETSPTQPQLEPGAGPARPIIIAMANQKGGVGKTTTTVNLAACLAAAGRRCLMVDIDPQANATSGLGVEVKSRSGTHYALLNAD